MRAFKKMFFVLVVFLATLVVQRYGQASPLSITDEDGKQMAKFEQAEKSGNLSLAPAMIAVLQRSPPADACVITVAAHALARFGDTGAILAFESIINNKEENPSVINYVRAQEARLQGESRSAGESNSKTQARVKVETFYQVLGLTPKILNLKVQPFNPNIPAPTSMEIYAEEELADMVDDGNYSDYAMLPGIKQVNFAAFDARKMRLAALSKPDRIQAMVKNLADSNDSNIGLDYMEMLLAAKEGAPAGEAALAQLKEMDLHREKHTRNNFSHIFLLIHYTHLSGWEQVRDHYKADNDPGIADEAANDLTE